VTLVCFVQAAARLCQCSAAGAESYKSTSFETSEESRLVLMILIEGNCHRSRGQLLSPRCHQSYGLVTGVPNVLGIALWNWIRCVKKKTLTIL